MQYQYLPDYPVNETDRRKEKIWSDSKTNSQDRSVMLKTISKIIGTNNLEAGNPNARVRILV